MGSFNPKSARDLAGIMIDRAPGGKFGVSLKVEFAIDGIEQLQSFWDKFDDKIRRKVLRKSVNAACRPVVKKVRALAPKQTGLFRRSITHMVRSYRRGGSLAGVSGQRGQRSKSTKALDKAASAAKSHKNRGGLSGKGKVVPIHLVNNPVKPHTIKANLLKGERLVFRRYGRINWERDVDHKGHGGRGFMEDAFSQTRRLALKAFETKFKNEVINEANKLKWTNPVQHVKDIAALRSMSGG